ncbi:809_t:CDS:2, partial [Gigaspora margarita]
MDHTCKLNDPHDSSWHCESGNKLEGIVSERESEEFNQERKKIQNYPQRIQEEEVIYPEVDLSDKEKTPKVNAEPKNLVLNLIKNFCREVLVKAELEKRKDPTFGFYRGFMEM